MAQIQGPLRPGADALWNGVYFNMLANTTLVKGDVVVIDTTATGNELGAKVTTTTTADSLLVCGVAMHAAADEEPVLVCVLGIVDDVNSAATVAAGDRLATSTTAGRCFDTAAVAAGVAGGVLGVGLETAASNLARCFIKLA